MLGTVRLVVDRWWMEGEDVKSAFGWMMLLRKLGRTNGEA